MTLCTPAALVCLTLPILLGSPAFAQQAGVAYLAIDLKTGAAIATERADLLDTPILAGSVMKIAALAAALESGAIDERTGILCTRQATVAGHRLTCTHPDLHRPIKPAEALAHSCNVFFATVGARLQRSALDRALVNLGLPPTDPTQPVAAAALGIEGTRVAPRRLVEMLARVTADPTKLPWRPSTVSVVREGLRGAVQYGSAHALSARGIDALAKTGTAIAPTGVSQGLVVGVTPVGKPTTGFVLVASGAAGMDAAALAADRLAHRTQAASPPALRIGIARADGRGYTVRTIPLEEYVAGVVAGEADRSSGPAALEALAITSRTFAMANRGKHHADGFDLCDLTHCQVLRPPTKSAERAAAATTGRILLDRGAPAAIYYTASCGGHTERPSAVWPGAADPAFLPSRADAACGGEPIWSSDLAAADLARALRAGGFKGDTLRDLRVNQRNSSGRVAWLHVDGLTPPEISGQDLRTLVGRTLGWQHIKSTAFELKRTSSGFRFAGRGSGHGVGLCVMGSARLAAQGETAEAILPRYFPGLEISGDAAFGGRARSELDVILPSGDEGERTVIFDLAVRTRGALAKRLGVAAPALITLRFHSTVESYQRATEQPWFTAGATLGADVHLLPLAVLKRRGLLERTLRHEMVHVLTGPALADRPLWVREGAAAYFAGEHPAAADRVAAGHARPPRSCPSDRELREAASSAALSATYARAAQCFARQIEAGKSWSEVRD